MQLSEMRYITGIITQGAGKIAGYSLAEPTGEIRKPDIVMAKDIASYLKSHNCKIINANVDAAGQVTFRSKADQESYVTLNSSGYVLGWPKKPLPKLHEGNKTGGKTGEILRPTHSYIVVDINETENVVKVMNLGGMVKPMTLSKLKAAVSEGLIVSNVEVKDGTIKLLSAGMDELTIGKAPSTPTVSANVSAKPVVPPTAPIKPPVSAPLAPPTGSKAVIPPVAPLKPVTPAVKPATPAAQPQATQTAPQPSIPPVTKPQQSFGLNFVDMAKSKFDFEHDFVKMYSGQKVKITLDLADFAPYQFELLRINGGYYLSYDMDNPIVEHEYNYFSTTYGKSLRDFLNLFNDSDTRGCLRDTKIELLFNGKPVNGFDYRMLYMENGFLNFAYLLDWNKIDLFHLSDDVSLMPKYMNPSISLLYIPNKRVNITKNAIEDTKNLYGRFYAHYNKIWYQLFFEDNLNENARTENLVIRTHPRAKISEMTDDCLHIYLDYPFGNHEDAKKCVVDLTGTTLRFIAKNAITLMHGANYEVYVPASCKRLHNDSISVSSDTSIKFKTLGKGTTNYSNWSSYSHAGSKGCTTMLKATTVNIHGTNVERIDNVGEAYYNETKRQRCFIKMADWTPLLNLTSTTIAIEDLPKSDKAIDIAPYCHPSEEQHVVNEWYNIGDWSETGKGKISVELCSNPKAIDGNINLLISGTVTKAKLELYNEKESQGYKWPNIDYLFVEEGVEELEIIACTLKYKFKGRYVPGYVNNYIKHLVLPASLRSLSLKLTTDTHKFVRNIYIADNSIMSRLDLDKQFKQWRIHPDAIVKYANERVFHDKNLLSDLIGSDLTNVEIIEFDSAAVKANLALCGITI